MITLLSSEEWFFSLRCKSTPQVKTSYPFVPLYVSCCCDCLLLSHVYHLNPIIHISPVKLYTQYSNALSTTQLSKPEKDLIFPNTKYVKCSRPKTPWCSATSCHFLQFSSQHAFLATLTHSLLWKIRYGCKYKKKRQKDRCVEFQMKAHLSGSTLGPFHWTYQEGKTTSRELIVLL